MQNPTAPNLELTAADGHRFSAYLARPAGTPRGSLVVVQEIFGVNPHIRSVADAYAADGYLAIAPALFDRVERGVELGYSPDDVKRGAALKAICASEAALMDLAAAVKHLQAQPSSTGRIGILGYCWGGLLSWLAACELPGLSSSVPYYGGGMPAQAARQPKCPVMAHFGDADTHIPMPTVEAFRQAQPGVTVHVYAAGHGFNCDQRGSFDAAAAALARQRTLAFLREHVG
jgi:carboxymethylenebutenolidase